MKKWIDDRFIKQIFQTNTNYTEWFGYYNYDVISSDGKKMLCNRATFDGRAITAEDKIDLGWYNIENGKWHYIDTTNSFNWQQGAMLQWLPGKGNENKVIYNISKDNHFKSVICNIVTGEKKYIDFPTYCVTPDGKYSISLNYERSYWCRAYHYQNVVNPKYNVKVASDDGIFKVDLQNNTAKRIVKIQDILAIDPLDDFDKAKHWLEHIMINKSGTRIAFLHRFTYVKGYTTRVCICDINGNNLQILPNWQHFYWSHMGWKGDDAFVLYTVNRNSITPQMKHHVTQKRNKVVAVKVRVKKVISNFIPKKLKKVIKKPPESYYQLYENKNGKFIFTDIYKDKLLNIDGHPSFTKDGKYMITDSYPDDKGYQRLIIYNTETRKAIKLGSFFSPFIGNPASCDLHPKLSNKDRMIVVDTAYSGKHRMIVFIINWNEVKSELQ